MKDFTIEKHRQVLELKKTNASDDTSPLLIMRSSGKRIRSSRKQSLKLVLLRNAKRLKNPDALADAFLNAEDVYGIPAVVLQALAFIESSYILGAINTASDDYGIMQVNSYNIKAYKFSKSLLLTDLQYSINSGAEVFEWFYKTYPLEEAVMRYNCGTRSSCIKLSQVKLYLRKFKRAL